MTLTLFTLTVTFTVTPTVPLKVHRCSQQIEANSLGRTLGGRDADAGGAQSHHPPHHLHRGVLWKAAQLAWKGGFEPPKRVLVQHLGHLKPGIDVRIETVPLEVDDGKRRTDGRRRLL